MEEEEGKRSGIETATATLMEYENKKQCGAEICGVVVAVLHDRDSRERKISLQILFLKEIAGCNQW